MEIHTTHSKNIIRVIVLLFFLGLLLSETLRAQPTCQPTSSGSNSIEFDSATNEYLFKVDGQTLYKYSINDGPSFDRTGANLCAVKAVPREGNEFMPSYAGGICAILGNVGKNSWDADVLYSRLDFSRSDDTVVTRWQMRFASDSIDYTYKFHISGRTLVIQVEVENQSGKATRFDLVRSEDTPDARAIRIPYLTLFSILYHHNTYTSMFFDWEVTNASRLDPYYPQSSSPTSVFYAQRVSYNPMTNGERHPLKETIYLTVSSDLNEVLPNLPGPIAPRKKEATDMIVVSYGPPFTWLLNPPHCDPPAFDYKYLDSLKNRGIENVAVIINQYQKRGFLGGLPEVLPANTFHDSAGNPICGIGCLKPASDLRGNELLRNLRNHVVDDLNYSFALYENYMDYYGTSIDFDGSDCALVMKNNAIDSIRGWISPCGDFAYILKPERAAEYLHKWSGEIRRTIGPTWSYLDVHSSYNPSDRVDYTASGTGGKFLQVLQKYRELPGILRSIYNGPVRGEGGNHFLYSGYFDDFDGRINTADNDIYGQYAPLLVDFDLLKIHQKSAIHGVGHYYVFYAPIGSPDRKSPMDGTEMLKYVATELAYGHGGLVSKELSKESISIDQAVIEYQQVLPFYKKIADVTPLEILYSDNGGTHWQTASEYIRDHPHWDNSKDSSDFMSQVKVRYPGGITIIVNRHPTRSLDVPLPGKRNSWYAYHANGLLGTGRVNVDSFALPPMNGWVVCDSSMNGNPDQPLLLSPDNGAKNISGPTVLRWEVTERATRYMVHIRTTNGDIEVTTPVTWYAIGNLPPGSVVIWSVTAINDGGKSIPSLLRSFITIPDFSPH
ncbi:MAG: fibronectin type III domain-containing protein [Bacteroidota bacterium]